MKIKFLILLISISISMYAQKKTMNNTEEKHIIEFINNKQANCTEFVNVFLNEFTENSSLQTIYFLNNYTPFINNIGFNSEQLKSIIIKNTNDKWIQLFDNNYKGFLKQTLDSQNGINLSLDEKQSYFNKILDFRDKSIVEFFSKYENKILYENLSNFNEIESINSKEIRDTVLYQVNNYNSNSTFKKLNDNNWVKFYENIIKSQFVNFKVIKNNSELMILEKILDKDLKIQVQMDKKYISSNIKTDSLILPNLKNFLIYNEEKYQFFYYIPYRNPFIANSSEDIDFLKKYTFFVLKTHFYLNNKILELL